MGRTNTSLAPTVCTARLRARDALGNHPVCPIRQAVVFPGKTTIRLP
jgi:hypothetical protein